MPKHTKKRSTIKRRHRRMKEHAEAIQMKAIVANMEMNAALTTEQQAQIGQDFIADIMELSERESKQKAAY
ncbi:hypothetical protein [Lactiplantibacillus plantarum]|uniref:hypothetical protein n=1 Tax=Lactiplantibacillus plantarum TaxID=1590 RepID=UPI00078CD412|nr:hypothetical protein [Lactiplantibacillus plantarum]AMO30127.1 hypothetical protein ABT40_09495 [Lactiplantibacillus plantarum]AZU38867.1 hypothetical protein B1H25_04575 [Lactiplantibacillus plantarum]MBO3684021.1 hypothetical protein [Lactiplantibacillus plantarum]MCI3955518.1 hypothetical protein [Lactiplantibacillus plantarum]MCW6138555.1 hypothetical protein [Lactiplantibacillus plantarum]